MEWIRCSNVKNLNENEKNSFLLEANAVLAILRCLSVGHDRVWSPCCLANTLAVYPPVLLQDFASDTLLQDEWPNVFKHAPTLLNCSN
jgi:hypothetical protein